MLQYKKGSIVKAVIEVIVAVVLVPAALIVINESIGNYTATQRVIVNLLGLFLVLGILYAAAKEIGLKLG